MTNNENKKLKVGILTFHRAHNYGAVLQCYALQETLKSLGYDACVIDYRQTAVEAPYSVLSWFRIKSIIKSPRNLQGYFRRIFSRIIRNKVYQGFRKRYLTLSKSCRSSQDIPAMDIYVVGSDQMWNFKLTDSCDSVYTGDFLRPQNSLLTSYAISANAKSLMDLSDERLRNICSRFDLLSFREQSLTDIVLKRAGLKAQTDLDPSLLKDSVFWTDITNNRFEKRKYVLLYQVRRPKEDKHLLDKKAKLLADNMRCELIDLNKGWRSPEDFVSLFKYAQCVVTSSFHAVAFSIIFERPLYAVMLQDGHDDRYADLLKSIGAEQLLVDVDFEPQPLQFDYSNSSFQLQKMRSSSIAHIKGWSADTKS